MLIRVLVQAVRTVRAAGWRPVATGTLYVVALAVVLPAPGLLLFVGMIAHNLVTFALIRQLAASRGISAKRDVPTSPQAAAAATPNPLSPETPLAALALTRPGPVTEHDQDMRRALSSAGQLGRSGMRLAIVQLLEIMLMVTVLLAVGGERVLPDEQPTQPQLVRLMIGLVPVSALISAFFVLAGQRIAIEGDHRVVLAVGHAIKIARTAYGTVFVLSLLEPLLVLGLVLAGDSWGTRIAAAVGLVLLRLLVTGALNEVYAEGPALELAGRQPGRGKV
ncbi:MAG: hypothetical protein ABIM89_19390 [Mycobacteriales bacterium]